MADTPQTLTFPNYSPARFAALQDALAKDGLVLVGNIGEVKKFGADVSYAYAGNELVLVVRSAPRFHNMDHFIAGLTKEINAVQ